MDKLTFDEFVKLINDIPQPDQSLGIFQVKVNNANRHYYFTHLKICAGANPDLFALGLRHYGSKGQRKQKYTTSKFYDKDYDDVVVNIWRHEFKYAYKVERFEEIGVITNTLDIQINW